MVARYTVHLKLGRSHICRPFYIKFIDHISFKGVKSIFRPLVYLLDAEIRDAKIDERLCVLDRDEAGNRWTVCAIIEVVSPEETRRRMAEMMKG